MTVIPASRFSNAPAAMTEINYCHAHRTDYALRYAAATKAALAALPADPEETP